MSKAIVGGVGSVVTLLTAYRWRSLEVQRAELNREFESINNKMEVLQSKRNTAIDLVATKERWAEDMLSTLDVIWKDRFDRFHEKLGEIKGFIKALPEAVGVLQGVESHFRYMGHEMKKFIDFDVAAATIHHYGLLLEYAEVVGVGTVSPTLQQLLQQDAVVDAICTSVENTKNVECPKSITDASDTFVFCMDQLQEARNKIYDRYGGVAMLHPAPAAGPSRASLLLDGLHVVLRALHVNTLSSHQLEVDKRRRAVEALFKNERQVLQTTEDIMAAMDYVASLRGLLAAPCTPRSQGCSPSKPDAPSAAGEDPLAMAIQNDHGVQLALQQGELWRNAAGTYLIQEQAKQALRAYHIIMSESMTRRQIAKT